MQRLILLLVLLMVISFSSICQASTETSRFEEIRYFNSLVGQFDTETIRYDKDPYVNELLIDVWIKTTPDANGAYSLNRYFFKRTERQMMPITLIDFDADGKIISKSTNIYNPNLWTPLIPETIAEGWYTAILKYAQANDQKLKEEFKQRKKGLL